MKFTKMHGTGNDFVMVNGVKNDFPLALAQETARRLCDRRFGIGSDGLILATREGDGLRMRMWNPDGSESEMCGNGVRCFALFAVEEGLSDGPTIQVSTGAGRLELTLLEGGRVRVDMGTARLTRGAIGMTGEPDKTFIDQQIGTSFGPVRGTAVSMGNPHLVVFVDDVDSVPLSDWGPVLERHALFPQRTNAHFVQVLDRGSLRQRTWERGAGATLACGTGACASVVAANVNGLTDRHVKVGLPGGELEIEYREDGRVFMTGPAVTVFTGETV
jgi:diaminopimelate epimerase